MTDRGERVRSTLRCVQLLHWKFAFALANTLMKYSSEKFKNLQPKSIHRSRSISLSMAPLLWLSSLTSCLHIMRTVQIKIVYETCCWAISSQVESAMSRWRCKHSPKFKRDIVKQKCCWRLRMDNVGLLLELQRHQDTQSYSMNSKWVELLKTPLF